MPKRTRQAGLFDAILKNEIKVSPQPSSGKSLTTPFNSKEQRIQELKREIEYYQYLYYNEQPEITDEEFDKLWDELRQLDPNNSIFIKVGSPAAPSRDKREHLMFMNSQDKVSSPQEFRKWATKTKIAPLIVQYKLDGISIELQFLQGKYIYGITRGDGNIGVDITDNVRKMKKVIPEIDSVFTGAIRGEIILSRKIFEQKYSDTQNPRNTASGVSKRKDGKGSEDLTVICYDATSINPEFAFSDELHKIEWLKEQGFEVVETQIFNSVQEVIDYRESINNKRSLLNFDIDGLVVKGKEMDVEDMSRPRPQKQIAFKFGAEEARSVVIDVEWSESGVNYTPVAVIKPVEIAGTRVERASLSNPDIVKALDIRIGSEVIVSKRGDIIPHVERVVFNRNGSQLVEIPQQCTCGTFLVNEGSRLYCPNPNCPKLAYKRLKKWIKKLNVKHFGDLILKPLYDGGKVRTIPDLYRLTVKVLTQLDRVEEKSATKALENLWAVKEIPLEKFIAGFHIEDMGERLVKRVVDAGYDTLEKIQDATIPELSSVDGFAEVSARVLLDGVHSLYPQMRELLEGGKISIKKKEVASIMSEMNGKSFCFTGKLDDKMKRADAEKIVTDNGGIVKNSVVKGLDYLVTNSTEETTKFKKARAQGTKIINQKEFLKIAGK